MHTTKARNKAIVEYITLVGEIDINLTLYNQNLQTDPSRAHCIKTVLINLQSQRRRIETDLKYGTALEWQYKTAYEKPEEISSHVSSIPEWLLIPECPDCQEEMQESTRDYKDNFERIHFYCQNCDTHLDILSPKRRR